MLVECGKKRSAIAKDLFDLMRACEYKENVLGVLAFCTQHYEKEQHRITESKAVLEKDAFILTAELDEIMWSAEAKEIALEDASCQCVQLEDKLKPQLKQLDTLRKKASILLSALPQRLNHNNSESKGVNKEEMGPRQGTSEVHRRRHRESFSPGATVSLIVYPQHLEFAPSVNLSSSQKFTIRNQVQREVAPSLSPEGCARIATEARRIERDRESAREKTRKAEVTRQEDRQIRAERSETGLGEKVKPELRLSRDTVSDFSTSPLAKEPIGAARGDVFVCDPLDALRTAPILQLKEGGLFSAYAAAAEGGSTHNEMNAMPCQGSVSSSHLTGAMGETQAEAHGHINRKVSIGTLDNVALTETHMPASSSLTPPTTAGEEGSRGPRLLLPPNPLAAEPSPGGLEASDQVRVTREKPAATVPAPRTEPLRELQVDNVVDVVDARPASGDNGALERPRNSDDLDRLVTPRVLTRPRSPDIMHQADIVANNCALDNRGPPKKNEMLLNLQLLLDEKSAYAPRSAHNCSPRAPAAVDTESRTAQISPEMAMASVLSSAHSSPIESPWKGDEALLEDTASPSVRNQVLTRIPTPIRALTPTEP